LIGRDQADKKAHEMEASSKSGKPEVRTGMGRSPDRHEPEEPEVRTGMSPARSPSPKSEPEVRTGID